MTAPSALAATRPASWFTCCATVAARIRMIRLGNGMPAASIRKAAKAMTYRCAARNSRLGGCMGCSTCKMSTRGSGAGSGSSGGCAFESRAPHPLRRLGGQNRADLLAGMGVAAGDRGAGLDRAVSAAESRHHLPQGLFLGQSLADLEDVDRLDVGLILLLFRGARRRLIVAKDVVA